MELHVDIISPEKPLYSGQARSVVAPAHDGEVGILPQHAPMVAKLGTGVVRIRRAGESGGETVDRFAVRQGFVQTAANKVIIIAEEAISAADVNSAAVSAELTTLRQQVESHQLKGDEQDKARARLAWLNAQKSLAGA
ncbi:MAG: ATP synthase F1 subunit epsilon [Planctomycetes bacterium]|nr:ATP synthase F1 subunit epsilon [Planctomycetota bacterium]NUQ33986.1 ATP synthase F1 subunit epsilon [Planctomycetaceae bacterium]